MKNHKTIIAFIGSLIVGLPLGCFLLPTIPLWKIIILLIIPILFFLIFNSLGGNLKLPPKLDHHELLNSLLENLGEENWREKEDELIKLKKINPDLAEQLLKMHQAYHANKQFTQNAAHELQTPLAIIKGYAELLLQAPHLQEKEAESIGAILHNINRLSRLNSALILLSKIEHGRFKDEGAINLNKIIDETLEHFSDMIYLQKLKIEKMYNTDFNTNMSESLAEILIANLLQNAIRHNLPNGFIKIETDKNGLGISNPGKSLETSPENLFKRFYRESKKEESLGLGLSIVKRIAGQSGLVVEYGFSEGVHAVGVKSKN